MNKTLIAVLLASLASVESACAEGFAIGPRISTLGPGVEAVGYLTENFNLRITGNYIPMDVHGRVDTTDYDAKLNMASVQGLIDWHPAAGNFRISAGVVLDNNEVKLSATPTDPTVKIGDTEYPSSEVGSLNGDATFQKWAPYLGIGYGNAVAEKTGLSFSFDIGVMFQGSPDISLHATGPIAQDPTFQTDLAKEKQDIQSKADNFKFYPVISFGICYQFQ